MAFVLCDDLMELIGVQVERRKRLELSLKLWRRNALLRQLFGERWADRDIVNYVDVDDTDVLVDMLGNRHNHDDWVADVDMR